ncbi:MAG TPA: hypothetical protein DCZ59_09955 [Bacteroidetes bacterium]|nr:hypothetical protein [Bacteroidota bacterium]
MARPTKYDPDTILPKMAEAIEKGMFIEQLAHHLSVAKDRIYEWEQEYPEFRDAVKAMRDACQNRVSDLLASHATEDRPGNASVAIFIAKNVLGWRDRQEVEQTVKGDASITVNLGGARSSGELDAGNA